MRRAIVVGASEFSDKLTFAPLQYPAKDARDVAALLRDGRFGHFQQVEQLINASVQEVRRAIERLSSEANRGDVILFYFSGHGRLGRDGSLSLVLKDTQSDLLQTTGLGAKELKDLFNQSRASQKALILDCCYSGAVGPDLFKGSVEDAVSTLAHETGTYILTASTKFQMAAESRSVGGGHLTRCLIEGIRSGAPAPPGARELTMSALASWVKNQIRTPSQQPQFWDLGSTGELVISWRDHTGDPFWADEVRRALSRHHAEKNIDDEVLDQARAELRKSPSQRAAQRVRLMDELVGGTIGAGQFNSQWQRRGPMPPPPPPPWWHALRRWLARLAERLRGWRPRAPRTRAGRIAASVAVAMLVSVTALVISLLLTLPDIAPPVQAPGQPPVHYLDRSGALIAIVGSQGVPRDLDTLPAHVPGAFIATEDRWFYSHPGFNPWSMGRALIHNMSHPEGPVRGGSTITQQLARNLFLNSEPGYWRKLQELILAIRLEAKFSKKELLELYLNRAYFGAGAYGIEAASQRYFGKTADTLTIGESALLAGLMKGPTRYSPVSAADRSALRATLVLDQMVRVGAITPEERDAAFNTPVQVNQELASLRGRYFVDWVNEEVRELVGGQTEDLVVETTLDLPLQSAAEAALRSGLEQAKAQGALVALDGEGRVRAYVGGADYLQSQFDRLAAGRRQATTAFTPFVYLTAMEQGRTPWTPVVDEPIKIGSWEPRNYAGGFGGPMTLEAALEGSVNTVAARLANEVGTGNVAATARRLGINSKIQLEAAMALGAVEVSPLEMAQAYVPFANGGYAAKPYGIERIRTASGQVLYDRNIDRPPHQAVIGTPALQYMNQMMRAVVNRGTGKAAAIEGYDLAGKTGTSTDHRDAWFIGYTGGFVTAVWLGKDDGSPMNEVTGGGAPARIWRAFMAKALPLLNAPAIPGGVIEPPAAEYDPVGDLLAPAEAATELAPASATEPQADPADAPY
ncbi:PBP1A family penicillin-binding protein [Phenylobacterium terrae]|uniref:peptidoglycan glycosyltransferase n=1 Tax=Phenylobacterium terrae TaxID=2665495 RepID=A0ABW4MWA8_9CAUL